MGDLRHAEMLKPSSPDTIALALAVEERFLDLCHSWLRVRGVQLHPPIELDPDVLRWREMRVRHKRLDFRNSDSELKSTKAVAQWTLDRNAELRGQPQKTLDCLAT